jgi:predicted enzyme related to lactoylglutathione lyase
VTCARPVGTAVTTSTTASDAGDRLSRSDRAVSPSRVVHLELHTYDLEAASAFYCALLQWRAQQIDSPWGSYHGLLGGGLDSGIVACGTLRAGWLPYVEVDRIKVATERARRLGASVLLSPREGPAGWRSVVSTPAGGEIAFWQQKR